MTAANDFAWMDEPVVTTPITPNAPIMQEGAQLGKDRIWFCDGEHIWFRRNKSNPATLERHNRFVAAGDYVHIGTNDDVECYAVREQSQFAIKPASAATRVIDLETLSLYDVRRQAAMAAVRRDWQTFQDILSFLRFKINAQCGEHATQANLMYGEQFEAIMASIAQRLGPSLGEISRELTALAARKNGGKGKIITLGSAR